MFWGMLGKFRNFHLLTFCKNKQVYYAKRGKVFTFYDVLFSIVVAVTSEMDNYFRSSLYTFSLSNVIGSQTEITTKSIVH